jgi:hypothetical protein
MRWYRCQITDSFSVHLLIGDGSEVITVMMIDALDRGASEK